MELNEQYKQELCRRYKQCLIALRPRGLIWRVQPGGITDKELTLISRLMAELHLKTEKMIDEADLRTTEELLDKWENFYGLSHSGSYEERLAALNAAAAKGRQDIPFYKEICKMQGCLVEIEEYAPFMVGLSECGGADELGSEDIVFYWTVVIKSAASDDDIVKLQRLIGKLNQSHTIFKFRDERGLL